MDWKELMGYFVFGLITIGFIVNMILSIKGYFHMKRYAREMRSTMLETDENSELAWNTYTTQVRELTDVIYDLEDKINELRIQVMVMAQSKQESPHLTYTGAKRGPKPRMTLND